MSRKSSERWCLISKTYSGNHGSGANLVHGCFFIVWILIGWISFLGAQELGGMASDPVGRGAGRIGHASTSGLRNENAPAVLPLNAAATFAVQPKSLIFQSTIGSIAGPYRRRVFGNLSTIPVETLFIQSNVEWLKITPIVGLTTDIYTFTIQSHGLGLGQLCGTVDVSNEELTFRPKQHALMNVCLNVAPRHLGPLPPPRERPEPPEIQEFHPPASVPLPGTGSGLALVQVELPRVPPPCAPADHFHKFGLRTSGTLCFSEASISFIEIRGHGWEGPWRGLSVECRGGTPLCLVNQRISSSGRAERLAVQRDLALQLDDYINRH